MRYAAIIDNDTVNGEGICVSLWTQGCPHHCKGCHNKEGWDFNGGQEVPEDFPLILMNKIRANGIQRNFSILGGEPLVEQNARFVEMVCKEIRREFPTIKIFLWSGYTYETIPEVSRPILQYIDVLIDGPFILAQRDITLRLRGSKNQRIIDVQKTLKEGEIVLYD